MKQEPRFFYVERAHLGLIDAEGNRDFDEPGTRVICLTRQRDPNLAQVRVALVEVEPSLIDKAWDAMTAAEKALMAPPWMNERVPTPHQIRELAKHLRAQAETALGAAAKLELESNRVMRPSQYQEPYK